MVTHSPATARGLKILVSAVRFCPWPYPLSLEFNQLQASALSTKLHQALCFESALKVLTRWSPSLSSLSGPLHEAAPASLRHPSAFPHPQWHSVDRSTGFDDPPSSSQPISGLRLSPGFSPPSA